MRPEAWETKTHSPGNWSTRLIALTLVVVPLATIGDAAVLSGSAAGRAARRLALRVQASGMDQEETPDFVGPTVPESGVIVPKAPTIRSPFQPPQWVSTRAPWSRHQHHTVAVRRPLFGRPWSFTVRR
jgi:hypothetical protein